ncbi:MAG: glycosyltransferase [Planctomycetota bacterium]|nr:glycosyltransferase [Planctomycetota bacterium]
MFPSIAAPTRGVFVYQRAKALRAQGVEVKVISPVPTVPFMPPASYRKLRDTPRREVFGGVEVRHPRYLMIPKVGMYIQDRAYARGIRKAVLEEVEDFRPDVLDAHYLYPDACAVSRVAAEASVPYVCSARGSDVKVLSKIPALAPRVRRALYGAARVIAVSNDLLASMRGMDLFNGAVEVIPNGIDPARFFPRAKAEARRELGLPAEGKVVVCVGHIAPVHGQHLIVEAMARPDAPSDVHAYLVGGGPDFDRTVAAVKKRGLENRITMTGPVPHEKIPLWFNAADGSLHPGASAGSPNAVLESLACGTPCLVTDLPEFREVVHSDAQGIAVARTQQAIARAIAILVDRAPAGRDLTDPPRTWDDVGREVLHVLRAAVQSATGTTG